MPTTSNRAKPAAVASRPAKTADITKQEIAKVFRALGLEDEQSRQRYLEWSEAGKSDPKPGFEVIERGDTRSFD